MACNSDSSALIPQGTVSSLRGSSILRTTRDVDHKVDETQSAAHALELRIRARVDRGDLLFHAPNADDPLELSNSATQCHSYFQRREEDAQLHETYVGIIGITSAI